MAVNGTTGEVQNTMDVEDEKAREQAMKDIAEYAESEGLSPAYIGSALIDHDDFRPPILENLEILFAESYPEAVGLAYLMLGDKYPAIDGYRISQMKVEEDVVYVDVEYDEFGMGAILPIDES